MSDDDSDDSSKTEDPTPKRLEESRRKGQVAMSREVNSWVMLLTATLLIVSISGTLMSKSTALLGVYIEHAGTLPGVPGGLRQVLGGALIGMLKIFALPALFLLVASIAGPMLQVGPLFSAEAIKPDIGKISLIKGWGRLFSMRSIVELVKGVLKLGVVTIVAVIMLMPFLRGIEHMVGLPVETIMGEMKILIVRMMVGVLIAYLIIAVIDLLYQRVDFYKKLRMTKQELKEEYKQSEGDPQIKSKLRQLRSQKARQRMMQSVPKADVVITNPTHYAVALQYDPDKMDAPLCLAKGADNIALKIRELAKENKISIYENPPLARALYATVEIDESIPPEHYQAVAQIISFVFKQKGKLR